MPRLETRGRSRALQALYAWDVRPGQDLLRVAAMVWDDLAVAPDERKFADIREFQKLAAADAEKLLKNLAQQLAIYATGRELTFSDRDEIAAIVASTQR